MLTPAEAEAAIAAVLEPVTQEDQALADSAGRTLRKPIMAERDSPPFDRVTMDGIAFKSGDGTRRSYRIAGIQPAGTPPLSLASADECIEVMTGAVLPDGSDTIVPIEQVEMAQGKASIRDGCEPQPGRYVHRRGSDARKGAILLDAGIRLGPPELAIAASAGLARLSVSRRLRVVVVSTGDELVDPGQPILDYQVRRSNSHGLAAALTLAGYAPASDLQLPDRKDVIEEALASALEGNDVLVISGGVSAGRFDHVPAVLASLRVRQVFHGIAQRPGRPMWFGVRAHGKTVFALPGNPVSVLVCLARYVIPALDLLSAAPARRQAKAVLACEFAFDAPLACFLPVALGYDSEGRAVADPRPTGGSGDFISLAATDGFIELPCGPATHRAGLAAPFYSW